MQANRRLDQYTSFLWVSDSLRKTQPWVKLEILSLNALQRVRVKEFRAGSLVGVRAETGPGELKK